MEILRLANIRNGLVYPHDDVCHFQSSYGHHAGHGYYRMDAMPYRAVIHLLKGGTIEIIDATHSKHKKMTDAQKFGVPTWCITFNRALDFKGSRNIQVCDWQTACMRKLAMSNRHRKTAYTIRKLVQIYRYAKPAVIGDNVIITCHRAVDFDDKPKRLRELLHEQV